MNFKAMLAALAMGSAAAGCAAPADAPEAAGTVETTAALHRRAVFAGVGVTALRVEEDSRCPAEVQCVQAGTVRVAVRLEERGAWRETVLTLAQPLGLAGGGALTLAAVCPYPRQPGPIAPADYRFTFALGPDGQAAPRASTSGRCR